ncbi:unnamed protein product [Prunus armeniaca]|uniref:Uncharacterized protein n=1 Tax=Prunus armeniaca TaxID=36596 RepID=A0A6J5UCJ2_PRUAR|nr:unnamed protein product [Prunus armeniaca]
MSGQLVVSWELLECGGYYEEVIQTIAAPFQLPEAEFATPKRKKRRHSTVENTAEGEGTRVETHNSILSLKMVHHYPLQQP